MAWASELDAGLRGNEFQTFLDSHPDHGIHPGAEWERTLWQRLHQCRGVVVLCTRHWLSSPWCVAEAILAREKRKHVFLLVGEDIDDGEQLQGTEDRGRAPVLPDFLKDRQFISLKGLSRAQAFEKLLEGLAKEHLRDYAPTPRRPYPGLESFQEMDAAVFFGRDDDIARNRCATSVSAQDRPRLYPSARCLGLRQVLPGACRGAALAQVRGRQR